MATPKPVVFSLTRRLLHWLTVLLLLVQVPLAWYMVEQPLSPAKLSNYATHKSLGMIVLAVTLLRLMAMQAGTRPALPASMTLLQQLLARLTQAGLLVLLVLMPITGWLMSSAANMPVSVFGLGQLPDLIAPDRERLEQLRTAHEWQSYILFSLAGMHLSGALLHFLIWRDNVLHSMWPWKALRRE